MTFVESLSQWLSKFISNPSEYIKNQNFWWLLFNNNKSNWANDTSSEAVWQRITNTRTAAQWRSKQQVLTDLLNSHQTMYTSALINRNNTASKQDMKDAQLDAFAALVKSRAIEDWDTDWDEYNTTADIVGHYIDLKNSPEVNKRLIEYANSQDDPYNFAMEMWVLLSPEDKRIREIQKGYEALFWTTWPKWIAKTEDFLANKLVWGLSSWVDKIKKWDYNELSYTSDSDEAPIVWAMENYARNTFGQHVDQLDEYQQAKMLMDLQDDEVLSKYLPNYATDFANKFEWAVQWVLTSAFPIATVWLEALSEVPVVWDVTSRALQNIARWVWQVIWDTVWLPITLNLNNQEERFEWYEALWGLFMRRDHEAWNPKWWADTRAGWDVKVKQFQNWLRWEEWKWIINEMVEKFKKRKEKNQKQKEYEESMKEQQDQVASQRVMEDLAWTLLNNWKSDFNSKMKPDLANWLANLPQRVYDNTQTFEWLTREVNDAQAWTVELQNAILGLFKWDKYKTSRANDNYTTPNWATVHPVADAIGLLREIYEKNWDKDNLALLDKVEKKLNDWEITVLDKKNLARQITNEANSFTDAFELKSGRSAKEAENIREYLQWDIRNADPYLNEFMTTTDSVYSNLSKVKKYSGEKAEKVSTHRDQQKLPTIWRTFIKASSPIVDTLLTKWKYIYDQAKKNAREPYKPTTLEKDLPTILKAFGEQKNKSVPWAWFNISAFMEMIDKWNYNEKSYAYENWINNFLEDIVESTDSTSKLRLNPREMPALEFFLREVWATEEQIKTLEKNMWVKIQKSLFDEVDWQKANDKVIGDKSTKSSKKSATPR